MKYDALRTAAKLNKEHIRRKRWYQAVTCLAAAVVFCTTYALVLPAITLERSLTCGLEEHIHTEACYTVPDNPAAAQTAHSHTDACYTIQRGELTCTTEQSEGHTHSEGCYGEITTYACGLAESEGHRHSFACYDETFTLACSTPASVGHSHTDACKETATALTCNLAEIDGHQHDDACYAQERVLTCDLIELSESSMVESAEPVLTCGLEEHTHDDSCEGAEEDISLTRVEEFHEMVADLPSVDEVDATLLAYEEAEDMEGYEAYFRQVSIQAGSAYAIYEDMSEEEKVSVSDADLQKLMDLEWLWGASVFADSTKITVYGIDAYATPVMLVRNETSGYSGMKFTHWDAVIVEEENGQLYVDQVITDDIEKNNLEAETENGFVLLLYNITPPTQVGDTVIVSFDYKNAAAGTNANGYGTVTFGSSAVLKPSKDNSGKLDILPSADTSKLIELNLYDYDSGINTLYNSNKKYPGFQQEGGEASGSSLSASNFGNNVTEDRDAGINGLTNKGGDINKIANSANSPISGAMKGTLVNGYPALADGTSLSYLFSDSTYATKQNSKSINGLFQHNPVTGAYTFNSREDHAQFDPDSNTFTLYDQIITPNFTMYPFGNFLPFNDIVHDSAQVSTMDRNYLNTIRSSALCKAESGYDDAYSTCDPYSTLASSMNTWIGKMDEKYTNGWTIADGANEYFAYITAIPDLDFNENPTLLEKAYCVDYDEPKNFFFGMEMKMEFMQPKGGLTGNDGKQPMVFYFTGDDDVWVYIDEVLFLDLSGIHRHVGGEIDFVEGEVRYYVLDPSTGDVADEPYETKTFAQILGSNASLSSSGTFADYTTHKFNFYYMERGAGSGVCRLNFNFPLLQKNSISVTKELTVDEQEKLALLGNPDFKFQVLEASSAGEKTETLFIGAGVSYEIYDTDRSKVGSGTTDSNGVFSIKAGQTAVFTGINENSGKYYVRELLNPADFEQFGTITVDGNSQTTNYNVEVGSDTFTGVDSPVKDSSDGSTAFHFNNQVTFSKLGSLEISKVLTQYPLTRAIPEFEFLVKLDGTPLPVGTAYTVTAEGGEPIALTVDTEGIIVLPAGATAAIPNIIAGSQFTVQETAVSSAGYSVSYTGSEGVTTDGASASGTIKTNTDVGVIVTNGELGATVSIPGTKTVSNPDSTERNFTFNMEQVTDQTGATPTENGKVQDATVAVSDSADFEFILNYLEREVGTLPATFYYKITETADTDLINQINFDETLYVAEVTVSKAEDGTLQAALTNLWKDGIALTDDTLQVSFTNTLFRDLTIKKELSGVSNEQVFSFDIEISNGDVPLSGTYQAMKVGTETSVSFNNGKATITLKADESITIYGLPSGATWTVKETTSDGYHVSWQINEGEATSSTSATGRLTAEENFILCINTATYALPSTGGAGTDLYTTGGLLLMAAAVFFRLYSYINQKKGGLTSL